MHTRAFQHASVKMLKRFLLIFFSVKQTSFFETSVFYDTSLIVFKGTDEEN